MSRSEIEQGLVEVFSAVLGHPVKLDLRREDDPAWDSLKHMQLVFAVEEQFGGEFTEEEIPTLDSLAEFAERLARRHAA